MIGFLLPLALKLGVPERFTKAAVIAALVILAMVAFFGAKTVYDHSVIAGYEAKQEAKQAKRERKADTNLNDRKQIDEQAAEVRKQEIDDATRNIPDQAPSARQRARACVELRRQAKERGKPEPAC